MNLLDFCFSSSVDFGSVSKFYYYFLVSKVVNVHGPQTQVSPVRIKEEKTETELPGVEERLRNIEEHLKIKSGKLIFIKSYL